MRDRWLGLTACRSPVLCLTCSPMLPGMSMKRTKQATKGRGPSSRELETSPLFATKKDETKWSWKDHVEGQPDSAFQAYSLATTFARGALLSHPKFGRGVVTGVDDKRIDVLFEEG